MSTRFNILLQTFHFNAPLDRHHKIFENQNETTKTWKTCANENNVIGQSGHMHFVYLITTEHPLEDPLLKILTNVLLNATKKRPHYETFVLCA